jgi:hypothetical protein
LIIFRIPNCEFWFSIINSGFEFWMRIEDCALFWSPSYNDLHYIPCSYQKFVQSIKNRYFVSCSCLFDFICIWHDERKDVKIGKLLITTLKLRSIIFKKEVDCISTVSGDDKYQVWFSVSNWTREIIQTIMILFFRNHFGSFGKKLARLVVTQ